MKVALIGASGNVGSRLLAELLNRGDGNDERVIEGSDFLAAAGRTPNTQGIGLGLAGVELDRRGYIRVNERLEMTEFNTDEFIVQGEAVVVFGSESGKVEATGQPFRNEWAQKYVVKDNQIT